MLKAGITVMNRVYTRLVLRKIYSKRSLLEMVRDLASSQSILGLMSDSLGGQGTSISVYPHYTSTITGQKTQANATLTASEVRRLPVSAAGNVFLISDFSPVETQPVCSMEGGTNVDHFLGPSWFQIHNPAPDRTRHCPPKHCKTRKGELYRASHTFMAYPKRAGHARPAR